MGKKGKKIDSYPEHEPSVKVYTEKKSDCGCEKSAVDNQWTNANIKYYPDERPERSGPGRE